MAMPVRSKAVVPGDSSRVQVRFFDVARLYFLSLAEAYFFDNLTGLTHDFELQQTLVFHPGIKDAVGLAGFRRGGRGCSVHQQAQHEEKNANKTRYHVVLMVKHRMF